MTSVATNDATQYHRLHSGICCYLSVCSVQRCGCVVVLPGVWSGETSNLFEKLGPISTDKDHSGTSDEGTYAKSARMANNRIKCYRELQYIVRYILKNYQAYSPNIHFSFLTLLLCVHCAVDCVFLSRWGVIMQLWLIGGRLSITVIPVFHLDLQRQKKVSQWGLWDSHE